MLFLCLNLSINNFRLRLRDISVEFRFKFTFFSHNIVLLFNIHLVNNSNRSDWNIIKIYTLFFMYKLNLFNLHSFYDSSTWCRFWIVIYIVIHVWSDIVLILFYNSFLIFFFLWASLIRQFIDNTLSIYRQYINQQQSILYRLIFSIQLYYLSPIQTAIRIKFQASIDDIIKILIFLLHLHSFLMIEVLLTLVEWMPLI